MSTREPKAGETSPAFLLQVRKKVTILSTDAVGAYCIMRCAPNVWRVSAVDRFLSIAAALWPHWPSIVLPFHRHVRQPRPSDRIADAVSAIPPQGLQRGRSTSSGMGGLNACRRNSPSSVFPRGFPIRLPQSRNGQIALALAVVYLVWGSTYLAVHVALGSFPPLLLSGLAQSVCRDRALHLRGAPQSGLAERG